MGIKDNFQQALRELTGTEKEEAKQQRDKQSVDAMKSAVAAGDTGEFDAIKEIDRRAAEAASEYERQQRAFTGEDAGQPQSGADSATQSPFGQDVSYNGQTGGYIGIEEPEPLSLGQTQTAQQNTGYQQQNTGFQQQSTGFQQQSTGFRQQNTSFQQPDQGATYGGGQSAQSSDPAQDQSAIFSAARYQHSASGDDEITVISRNTVIDGNVRSFANMSVDGNIKGNVETTKDIDLNGKIVGNIACNNAQMRTSQIQGNVQMKGNAYMERDTLLIGDLTSTYANVNGKIKGNLDITGKAELKSDAVVFGDISASTITVLDGAIIQGYVSTTFLNKEESKNIFPDTITIGE